MRTTSTWLRIGIPAALIIIWLGLAGIGGPYFGKISEVTSNDQTSFLPASAESTKAQELQASFQDNSVIPAIIVLERQNQLQPEDFAYAKNISSSLKNIKGIDDQASPAIPSEDGQALQIIAGVQTNGDIKEVVQEVRETLKTESPDGLNSYVTGPAGSTADLSGAFGGIDGLLLGVALSVVFIILLIVYRSPLLPFLVLFTASFALAVSILIVWNLAKADILQINGQVQGILFILVIGAATDYSLLYVARYKEALLSFKSSTEATLHALKNSFEPIVASGATVIAGLLCLLLSDLNSNKALGPVASVGIAMSLLAALTFLPAVLLAFGRKSFWPRQPLYKTTGVKKTVKVKEGIWPRIANFVDVHYRRTWIVSIVVLSILSLGAFQLKADGVEQNQLILGTSEARDGEKILSKHFPGGSGAPTTIIVPESKTAEVAEVLVRIENISNVTIASKSSPSGNAPINSNAKPVVADGNVLLRATLKTTPDSSTSEQTIKDIRDQTQKIDSNILVGGTTAVALDTNTTSLRDRNIIIPVVLVVVTIILMLLLRSIIAPLVLLIATVLSFTATLGVAAILFNNVLGFPGADPSVPLYGFVFLVALGIDYNIFLMTRVREESIKHGTRQGIKRGLAITGGVITSAGVVLAATFSALAVIPILFLAQLAFIVAFGVLLDTILVRSLLVPSVMRDIGSFAWWPSKLSRSK